MARNPGDPRPVTSDAETTPDDSTTPGALTRRGFLAVGGALFLVACGSDGSRRGATSAEPGSSSRELSLAVGSSALAVRPDPQRFAFVVQQGTEYVVDPAIEARFQKPGGAWSAFMPSTVHTQGLDNGLAIHTAEPTLDVAGDARNPWGVEVRYGGKTASAVFVVAAVPVEPVVGQAAPRAASPTGHNTLGVDPICTRVPPCPLHTRSAGDVIGAGKPVALMFATPARCQTQLCAPSLDMLLDVMKPYRDAIEFIHVEIYKDKTSPDVAPTVAAWKLASEPFFYGIDATGTIVGRLDGAFGGDEVDAIVKQLASA